MPDYPPPPWHTHGLLVGTPYVTRTRDLNLTLPAVSWGGRSAGLLAYVEYVPPSPLSYHELIWLPSMVRDGRRRGYQCTVMYVDDEATLAAGREVWALPKTMARFERRGNVVEVETEDTYLRLRFRSLGPAIPQKGKLATIQTRGDERVRFRAEFRAPLSAAMVRVDAFTTTSPAWDGFPGAGGWRPGGLMPSFESTMNPPQTWTP